MNRKLIFLDIDGTLVTQMKAPSDHVKKAVRSARSNGHKVFLCTGRKKHKNKIKRKHEKGG